MLVAKSIRTGCPPFTGKPVSAYSQSALEQKGRHSRSRIGDEHRGQRTPNFDGPADPYERLLTDLTMDLTMDSKQQPHGTNTLGSAFGTSSAKGYQLAVIKNPVRQLCDRCPPTGDDHRSFSASSRNSSGTGRAMPSAT